MALLRAASVIGFVLLNLPKWQIRVIAFLFPPPFYFVWR